MQSTFFIHLYSGKTFIIYFYSAFPGSGLGFCTFVFPTIHLNILETFMRFCFMSHFCIAACSYHYAFTSRTTHAQLMIFWRREEQCALPSRWRDYYSFTKAATHPCLPEIRLQYDGPSFLPLSLPSTAQHSHSLTHPGILNTAQGALADLVVTTMVVTQAWSSFYHFFSWVTGQSVGPPIINRHLVDYN